MHGVVRYSLKQTGTHRQKQKASDFLSLMDRKNLCQYSVPQLAPQFSLFLLKKY